MAAERNIDLEAATSHPVENNPELDNIEPVVATLPESTTLSPSKPLLSTSEEEVASILPSVLVFKDSSQVLPTQHEGNYHIRHVGVWRVWWVEIFFGLVSLSSFTGNNSLSFLAYLVLN